MDDRKTGWLFVAVQAVLLLALIFLPHSDHWPTPGWLNVVATALTLGGFALVIISALGLGSSLTPTPVPKAAGSLRTTGLYGLVRHPIYTGVLAIALGLVVPSGNVITGVVGLITVAFFTAKAKWEETRLTERYPEYPAYAARTGRFVPRIVRR